MLGQYEKSGALSQLHVAFSRDGASKVRVFGSLWLGRASMWCLCGKHGAAVGKSEC